MVDDGIWSYDFHLEYKQGVLHAEKVAYPYTPVPVQYIEAYKTLDADFYGVIWSIKNKEEARFGFMAPTTTDAAGNSGFTVRAPQFADADHVSFYSKANKHLFDISVKDSSFCNDNSVCDENVGENGANCPNDCHTITSPPIELVVATTPPPTAIPVVAPNVAPTPATQQEAPTNVVLTTNSPNTKTFFTPGVIIMLVGGLLFVVLGIILLRVRKNMD